MAVQIPAERSQLWPESDPVARGGGHGVDIDESVYWRRDHYQCDGERISDRPGWYKNVSQTVRRVTLNLYIECQREHTRYAEGLQEDIQTEMNRNNP